MAIQRLKITFEVLTRADTPLTLTSGEQAALREAFEEAVSMHVNMNCYGDTHTLLGADIEVTD